EGSRTCLFDCGREGSRLKKEEKCVILILTNFEEEQVPFENKSRNLFSFGFRKEKGKCWISSNAV
ncbi:MAG: hypothetical protein II328_00120, partial [Clostridia bacterium]|nr:hypothetical protein [Clostridia bacterium]